MGGVVSTDEVEQHHQTFRKSLEQEEEGGLKFFRGYFVLDYVNTICNDQRRQRLLVSFVGHILHIALYLILLFITTESSRVADLGEVSRVMAGTTSDEWNNMESLDDWYLWLQTRMLPSFYKQDWYTMHDSAGVVDTAFGNGTGTRECEAGDTLCKVYIQQYNMIVGSMRIQQKRVHPSDICSIASNSYREGDVCYGYLMPENGYNAGLDMFFNFIFLFEFSASGAIYKQIFPQAFTRGFFV